MKTKKARQSILNREIELSSIQKYHADAARISDAKRKIAFIRKAAKEARMDEVSVSMRNQVRKRLKLELPDAPRTKYALEQVSFKKDVSGLTVSVHTNFVESIKGFTKHNRISVIIETTNSKTGKKLYEKYFNKTGDFEKKIAFEMEYLDYVLRNRPIFKRKYGTLYRKDKKNKYEWIWKNETGKIIKRAPLLERADLLNKELARYVLKSSRSRIYYHGVTREKMGIRTSISEIKKPSKIGGKLKPGSTRAKNQKLRTKKVAGKQPRYYGFPSIDAGETWVL